jgi:chromosome segregation ATPase
MTNNDKILQVLEDLQAGQKALQTGQHALQAEVKGMKADVAGVKSDVGNLKTDIAVLQGGQKTLESGQKTLDLKIEAVHAYQKQAHTEIMEHLIESNEVNGQAQQHLEQEIEHIKKHVGLPPVK